MKLNKFIFTLLLTFLTFSCAEYKTVKTSKQKEKVYYSSMGFALIYENDHYTNKIVDKKINNEKIEVIHNSLRKNTSVKITNPNNGKFFEAVINKKGNYPKFFNLVISQKAASILELDFDNPYVEILEVKKNKKFVAKESNTYDEEKNVAEKLPVDEIKMDDLSKSKKKLLTQKKVKKNNMFLLVISDFYFKESAQDLKKELINKRKNSLSRACETTIVLLY